MLQQDINSHREPVALLEKQRLEHKFVGQKQDMILMRNLTASLAKRWEKVHSKSLDRSHQIDVGCKEAKMFNDGWKVRMTTVSLDSLDELQVIRSCS